MPPVHDILLSQRFLPEFGGSIRWMHEVYRRWPAPVTVVTHDYHRFPPRTPEFPRTPAPPEGSDLVGDPNLRMDRRDIFIRDWGIEHPSRALRYLRMTWAVNGHIRRHPGATIRIHCTHAVPEAVSLIPLRWRYGRRLKIICYAHGEEITACCSSRQLKFLMRRAHGVVDLMLANSHFTASMAAPHMDAGKVRVVNPGVDLHEFRDAEALGAELRRQRGWENRLVVLTVGRLDPRKNHVQVIRSVAQLVRKHPQLLYVIAGAGREGVALQALTEELGMRDRVIFAGAVDGPTRLALYGACDLFAMPAIQVGTDVEGFGMVFLEAGACGKPSLAGCVGGQADAVRHERTGLVVDGADRAAVTAALDRLATDNALRKRLGEQARQEVRRYDWPAVVQRTVQLVEELQ